MLLQGCSNYDNLKDPYSFTTLDEKTLYDKILMNNNNKTEYFSAAGHHCQKLQDNDDERIFCEIAPNQLALIPNL